MLRQILGKLNSTFNYFKRLLKNIPLYWNLSLLNQLRFKFSALRQGIKDNKLDDGLLFNLRRNVHRLEKGLSYNVIKPVFATDYIFATIQLYQRLRDKNILDQATNDWAVSVFKEYFRKTDNTQNDIARALFLYKSLDAKSKESHLFPYSIDKRHTSDVDFDSLLDLSLKRRSVRYFYDKKIEFDVLEKLFSIAKLSPSACNRQAFRFLFYNDKQIVSRLSSIPGGVSGYELFNLIVVVGDYSGYFNERDINAPIVDASLASMSLLYACETLGLGSVCINWPNLPDREKNIRKVLSLKKSEFVIMMIGLGYPNKEGKIPYSKKRSNKDFLLINERIKK